MSLWFREKAHRWVVYPLSESLDRVVVDMCTYVPRLDQEEQVSCCLVLRRQDATTWHSGESLEAWQTTPSPSATALGHRIDLAPSTLLVVGTARSTLYVYDCGVLLMSFVLPTPPREM